MVLVGRRHELAELARLLDRAQDGHGGLLVVSGSTGSGKTALADAAAEEGRRRRFQVVRASPAPGLPGRTVWAQVLHDLGAGEQLVATVLGEPSPSDLDAAARALVAGRPRLVVVDDLDHGGHDAIELLSLAAARSTSSGTAIVAVTTESLGFGAELRLGGLAETDLSAVVGDVRPDVAHALWVASRGFPGVARSLAARMDRDGPGDPVVRLALEVPSRTSFLDVDPSLIRLLELALERASDDGARARVLARLARELLGDAALAARRRQLADEALTLARQDGDPGVLAAVLDARLHALWDPAGADDRLAAASEIVDLARVTGDGPQERRGLFWRFVALMELGRVGEAESALAEFEREAILAGDREDLVMVTARHAMLAILRGRFEEAKALIGEVAQAGRRIGLPDTDALVGTLSGAILVERGRPDDMGFALEILRDFARRSPGHLYEATIAGLLANFGQVDEAAVELERILPRALQASGPRWLGSVALLSLVAAACGNDDAVARLYDALLPYRGRLVVFGGANTVMHPVAHVLGVLAADKGALDDAVAFLEEAIRFDEQIGALPFLAHSLAGLADALDARGHGGDAEAAHLRRRRARAIAESLGMTVLLGRMGPTEAVPRGQATSLVREGELWAVRHADVTARLRDSKGLHYLAELIAHPGVERHALDLVALTEGAPPGSGLERRQLGDAGPLLDDQAKAAYKRRLLDLREEVDEADALGDDERAERARTEIDALATELARAVGLGGHDRVAASAAERARLNVTRALRAAIARIGEAAPDLGRHLDRRVRTGLFCAYEPTPGDSVPWT